MKLFFLMLVLFPCSLWATLYKLDASHTNIGFKVKHLVISTVNGRFNHFEGTFNYDESKKILSDIKVSINANSIDTNEPDRDKHLKSDDFFGVEKFKTLEFTSTKITKKSNGKFSIEGNLKIKDVTKAVRLDAEIMGPVTDPWQNKKLAFNLTSQIKRSEFGLTWNKALETGGVVVDDKINIIIEGESTAQ